MVRKLIKVWNPCPMYNCTMMTNLIKVWNPFIMYNCTMVTNQPLPAPCSTAP